MRRNFSPLAVFYASVASQDIQMGRTMPKQWVAVSLAAALLLAGAQGAQAKGCIKGAAVGAVAGHVARHHAVLGAAAGCIVGHHLAKKKEREEKARRKEEKREERRQRLEPKSP
jgi:outer membrane lipoprotein SlyB